MFSSTYVLYMIAKYLENIFHRTFRAKFTFWEMKKKIAI